MAEYLARLIGRLGWALVDLSDRMTSPFSEPVDYFKVGDLVRNDATGEVIRVMAVRDDKIEWEKRG